MNSKRNGWAGLVGVLCFTSLAPAQTVVTVRSGNGPTGSTDPLITMLPGPEELPFSSPFGPADFAAAQAGPPAHIVSSGRWLGSLPSDPLARWIATSPNFANEQASCLYAMDFVLPVASVGTSTLDFWYSVDNHIGYAADAGLYLNTLPVPGTQYNADYTHEYSFNSLDVTAFLHPGRNTLYVYQADVGGPSGIIFSARFSVAPKIWDDLGFALAGSTGLPTETGSGDLVAGSPLAIALVSAKPFAPCFLVVGVSNLSAPFKGGVLVPYATLMFGQTVDFFGEADFGGLWPPGIPSGFTVYFQYWIVDAAGPYGFAASNAVSGTTP